MSTREIYAFPLPSNKTENLPIFRLGLPYGNPVIKQIKQTNPTHFPTGIAIRQPSNKTNKQIPPTFRLGLPYWQPSNLGEQINTVLFCIVLLYSKCEKVICVVFFFFFFAEIILREMLEVSGYLIPHLCPKAREVQFIYF